MIREWDDTPDDFGRIAAQTAKQVILQRIREAERDLKYEEYAGREGDIVTGIVQQTDNRYTLLDLGKVEALLPQAEQVPYERYEHGARLKAYIVEVRKTTKGPQIVVSRSHPGLIKRLFELEVPEISSGVVEIRAAAREPGHRTKIAVWSNDPNVDPVGACVGARGSRVRMVTNELRGERVDVVPFSDDPVEFIQAALAPARVREVRLDDETGYRHGRRAATTSCRWPSARRARTPAWPPGSPDGASTSRARRSSPRKRPASRRGMGRGRVGRERGRRDGVAARRRGRGGLGAEWSQVAAGASDAARPTRRPTATVADGRSRRAPPEARRHRRARPRRRAEADADAEEPDGGRGRGGPAEPAEGTA